MRINICFLFRFRLYSLVVSRLSESECSIVIVIDLLYALSLKLLVLNAVSRLLNETVQLPIVILKE